MENTKSEAYYAYEKLVYEYIGLIDMQIRKTRKTIKNDSEEIKTLNKRNDELEPICSSFIIHKSESPYSELLTSQGRIESEIYHFEKIMELETDPNEKKGLETIILGKEMELVEIQKKVKVIETEQNGLSKEYQLINVRLKALRRKIKFERKKLGILEKAHDSELGRLKNISDSKIVKEQAQKRLAKKIENMIK